MSKKKTTKAVKIGVEEHINNFAKTVGGSVRDINKKLKVIELRLSLRRNKFYLQFIFNPWSYDEAPPIVEITGVDINPIQTDFYRLDNIDDKEGRYRITILEHKEWSIDSWKKGQDTFQFWEAVKDVLESLKVNGLAYRNLSVRKSTWDLFFPIGIKSHLDRLEAIVKQNNWELLTEKESEFKQKQKEIEDEKERIKLDGRISKLELDIEKSESLADLIELENSISDGLRKHERYMEMESKIEKRKMKLQPNLETLNFDNPNFTSDNEMTGSKKKKQRIRRYEV